jgi:hypothetical protein
MIYSVCLLFIDKLHCWWRQKYKNGAVKYVITETFNFILCLCTLSFNQSVVIRNYNWVRIALKY